MDARTVLALSLAPLLAACVGPGAETLTAEEAIAAALEAHPGASLVGAYGVEGPSLELETEPRLAFRDDGLADGPVGDGRLSSWVVGLLRDSLIEVRVGASGQVIETLDHGAMPEFTLDERVYRPTSARIDSPDAAPEARKHPCIADSGLVGSVPLGYRYSYSLYNETTVGGHYHRRDDLLDGMIHIDRLGWSKQPDTWTVTVHDATPGSPHRAAMARLDAGGHPILELDDEGELRCEGGEPYQPILRYDFDSYRDGGDGNLDIPIPWSDQFEVGPRVARVRALLQAQGGGLTDDATVRLSMGDGSLVYDDTAWRLARLDLDHPASGTWTVEVVPPEMEPALGSDELPRPLRAGSAYVSVRILSYERPGP